MQSDQHYSKGDQSGLPEKSVTERNAEPLKAGAWYMVSSVIVKGVAFLTTPIFARILTKHEYGIVSAFNSWCALLLPFFSLNLAYSVGRAKLDFPDRLNEYIGSMQLLSAVVSISVSAICIALIGPISSLMGFSRLIVCLLLLYLVFTPAIGFVQNGYRYRYLYKQNIAIAIYLAVGSVLCSLLLIRSSDGDRALLRVLGIVTPYVVLSLLLWGRALVKREVCFDAAFWRYGLLISLPLIFHSISLNILSQSDRIFIQKLVGTEETAIYGVVYTYGSALSVVTATITDAWLPWFHDNFFINNFAEIRKNVKWIVAIGCYVGLACIGLAPEAVLLLGGKGYIEGVPCVVPIVLGVTCQFIYTHYVNIEMYLKKTWYVSAGTILAAALNIVLNFIFIPIYGYVAAAYTTLASYIVLLIGHFAITRFVLKVKLYDDIFMFGSLLVCFVAAAILMFSYQNDHLRFSLVLAGFISFVITFRNFIFGFFRKRKK